MNSSPDRNSNRTNNPNQMNPNLQNPGAQQRPAANGQAPRRPMTEEERRRQEAARLAARQANGRLTDEELRRRRLDQQRLNAMQPAASTAAPSQASRTLPQEIQRRRKHRKISINAGAVIFVLLMAAVIGISVRQIRQNEELPPDTDALSAAEETEWISGDDEITSEEQLAPEGESVSAEEEKPPLDAPEPLPTNVTVDNSTMDEGKLILVNYAYPYAKADQISLKNAYSDRTVHLKVADVDTNLEVGAFAALEAMVVGLQEDTECDDLLIVSGHRTVEEQQSIYESYLASNGEDYVKAYVAVPGCSEHHTGLACDLSFYLDEGYSVPIPDHEFGFWLGENCMKYGFVRRYPEDKVDITHIQYEAWHFRYVGIPNALAMTAMDLCLEEYIDALRGFAFDGTRLWVQANGTVGECASETLPSDGWLIYFVPAAEGETTEIPLPAVYTDYEVSGNNVDGFIVTVSLAE